MTKLFRTIALIVVVSVLYELSFFLVVPYDNYEQVQSNVDPSAIRKTNLPFIENQGQIQSEPVKYYAKTFAGTIYVTNSDLTYYSVQENSTNALAIKEKFLGNQLHPKGTQRSESVVSYFKGNEEDWKTNIPTYDTVSLGRIWNNVDIDLKAHGKNVEKIFTIHQGGNPTEISMSFDGITKLGVSNSHELVVSTDLGNVLLSKPIGYQIIDGERRDVPIQYIIKDSKTYGFSTLSYDPRYDLVIDPLIASTFIGGSSDDFGHDIVRDSSGNIYVTGGTKDGATDFPTTAGAYNTTNTGLYDVFVSKFNSNLSNLTASTFIGGSADDFGRGIALDSSGNVYVVGDTEPDTTPFPTTAGAYNRTYAGTSSDVFVSKLSSNLSSLTASTLIGGSGVDEGRGIALDSSGNVYIAGRTDDDTTDFPVTTGAYDLTHNGSSDVFVSKFNSNLSNLTASTFIGGGTADLAYDIALDSSSNVYVTGYSTFSVTSFPTTAGVYNQTNSGSKDVFVSKLNSALSTLSASTFIGGSGNDIGYGIALDSSSNVYVTGSTTSGAPNYPVTTGAYDLTHNGSNDVFVSKLNSALSTLSASTFIGGGADDESFGIALDSSGNVYITGYATSDATNYPVTTGAYDLTHNGSNDVFVSKLNSALSTLSASTFIGGDADDFGNAITLDSSGNVYITGETYDGTTDFPVTTGAYDTSYNGGTTDAFVSILDCSLSASGASCGTVSSGGTTSVPVSSGGTAQVSLPSGNNISVKLPAGNSGTINFTDTNSGTSDSSVKFIGNIVNVVPSNGASCSTGCTISFTFTGAQATALGVSPSQITILHDTNEDGSFQSDESITTTITGTDPYTATGTASFTSKFAVGGVIRANAVAATNALSGGGYFGFLNSCDSNGYGGSQSLKVYSISYDKCVENDLKIEAYSTCGPVSVQVTTKNQQRLLGLSSDQPFLNNDEKKLIFSTPISQELESVSVLVKDKRDSFTDKIIMNQCSETKNYTHTTGYTSEQQSPSVANNAQSKPVTAMPSWIKNNAGWWSSGQIGDDEFKKGLEFMIQNNIILVDKTTSSEISEPQQIPSWIKNNAGWWSQGQINDSEFMKGIEYLIKSGIIRV